MRRDFSRDISTDEDRLTFRKWVRGFAIFYGLVGLFVVGFVAVRKTIKQTSRLTISGCVGPWNT